MGEVGDVIVGGVSPPPGATLWEQRNFIHEDKTLREFLLNEPRGGVFRHVNLLVPPKHPEADAGFIIMEPEFTPPMSGSNAICVATVLLETGIIPMREPVTSLKLEAPGGLIEVEVTCSNGKAERVLLLNVPSFVDNNLIDLQVPGLPGRGWIRVETAYGGDSFVIVDAEELGFQIEPSEARELAQIGPMIIDAANDQFEFDHPANPEWNHISFCLFAGRVSNIDGVLHARSAVSILPGKIDRSPTGTGVSARLATLHARSLISIGQSFVATSIIGSQMTGEIVDEFEYHDRRAITPRITGQAWITGFHQHTLDPTDPWPRGYRLSDTWGN